MDAKCEGDGCTLASVRKYSIKVTPKIGSDRFVMIDMDWCGHESCRKGLVRPYKEAMAEEKGSSRGMIKTHGCSGCGRFSTGMMVCGGCMMEYYCSKDCQKDHWKKGHDKACKEKAQRKKQIIK